MAGRKSSKRTLIEPHKGDRRYVRRNQKGQFKTEVNVGRSLAADRRHKAKTKASKGHAIAETEAAETLRPNCVATVETTVDVPGYIELAKVHA